MNWITKRLPSVRIIFTISLVLLASLSNNLAGAQQMCADLFEDTKTYIALKDMSAATEALLEKLAGTHEMTVAELTYETRESEKYLESYLDAAGFSYKRITQTVRTKPLKDAPEYVLSYGTYEITGSREGSAPARLIHGVQVNPKFKESHLKFVVDPLHQLKNNSLAHFIREDMTISLGPSEFSKDLLAMSSTIRHEVQHFFEEIKMMKGEDTLARIELKSAIGRPDAPYSMYFRADEVETHLRDLRYFSNLNHQQKRDSKLLELGFSPDFFPGLRDYRQYILRLKKETLKDFEQNLRKVIIEVEANLKNGGGPVTSVVNRDNGDIHVSFFTSGHFGAVTINLNGKLKVEDLGNSEKMRAAALEVLKWSQDRLNAIDRDKLFVEPKN
jgi:hypothetical protein